MLRRAIPSSANLLTDYSLGGPPAIESSHEDFDFYRSFFIAPSKLNMLEAVVPRIAPGRHALFAHNLRTASRPLSHEIQYRSKQLYSWALGR